MMSVNEVLRADYKEPVEVLLENDELFSSPKNPLSLSCETARTSNRPTHYCAHSRKLPNIVHFNSGTTKEALEQTPLRSKVHHISYSHLNFRF